MPTAYDQVLYRSVPFRHTHPDRMAVMGTLFGLDPAPPGKCRFLEIACADGGNLIPMACELPGSTFVGFDLAHTVIETGRRQIAELGLTNIRLEQRDLMDVGSEIGRFDYIVAHGLYSWVPEPVRDKLMSTVKALLTPQGIAYISYNAFPGCRVRQALRDMLLFHLRDTTDPDERLRQARDLLQGFIQSETPNSFAKEAQTLLDKPSQVLYHDELGEVYHPVYVHELAAHAARFGLRFLSEAGYPDMQIIDQARRWAGESAVIRESYNDFFRLRAFRRTLLCHAEVEVPDALMEARIPLLHAASNAKFVVPDKVQAPGGASAEVVHPLARAALARLIEAWPECVPFRDLPQADSETGTLATIVHAAFAAKLVELHAVPPRCIRKPGSFPRTTALARWQASRGPAITTPRHTAVNLEGELERRFLCALDGTRDRASLSQEFGPIEEIEANLGRLVRLGLVVG